MAYVHNNKTPIVLKNDPVDPDTLGEWAYFSYGTWLRDGETIVSHSGIVTGGEVVTDSTYLGTMTDTEGTVFEEVYGVQFKVTAGAKKVTVTHRKTTQTTGSVNLSRVDIDHSAVILVKTL